MRLSNGRKWAAPAGALTALLLLSGCPGLQNSEYVAGSTGSNINLGNEPSLKIFTPESDLSITQGTPVEVTWLAVGTTSYATVDLFIDNDTDLENGVLSYPFTGMPLTQMAAQVDTRQLAAGEYRIGLLEKQLGEVVVSAYAPGTLYINSSPTLFFNSPRNNYRYDRSPEIQPSFDVDWTLDPQARVVTTQIFLDPDGSVNGNEVLLRTSSSQTGDRFTFDLPTAQFEPGTYRILAQVTDGRESFAFYAPGSIVLRARLCGAVDLRGLDLATSAIRGAVFEGVNPRDNAGSFVCGTRDLDGDGFDDFLILSQFAKPGYETGVHRTGVGEAYLIYGRPQRFSGRINLNSTGTLFRGDIFAGVPEMADPIRPSRGITSFTMLSDWDLDGLREFAFGLPFTDSYNKYNLPLEPSGYFRTGGVVVACGSVLRPDVGFPGRNVIDLGLIGTEPHKAIKVPVGCPEGFVSAKYSLSSHTGPEGTTLFHEHLSSARRGMALTLGCRFASNDFGDQFGESISSWDFHSLVISAPNRDPSVGVRGAESAPGAGMISIYFNATYSPFFPWTLDNAPPGNEAYNYAPAGNHPAASLLPHGGPYHYVLDDIRGQWSSPGYWVEPDDNPPCVKSAYPMSTLTIWSDVPGAHLTHARGIGDMNADGLFDLLVGAPFMNDGAGACFIVLGRVADLLENQTLNVRELSMPMDSSSPHERRILDGIQLVGEPGDRLGQEQDDAGDFNNDGLADVVIGSPELDNRRGGAGVFFGSREAINLTQQEIRFSELPALGLGVIFLGREEGDLAGARVTTAGDVDGDGNSDILIAAPEASVRMDIDQDGTIEIDRTRCGVVYLIYGSPDLKGTISLADIGTERLPGVMFIGRNSGDELGAGIGEMGDRSRGMAMAGDVDGDGHGDLLLGSVSSSPRDRARAGEAYLIYGVGD